VIADPSRPWLLVAGEGSPATVSSYRLNDSGRLDELSHLPTGGDHACHLALTDDHRHLLTANYGSGSVSSFAVGDDGTLTGPLDVVDFAGSGPDADRQDRPHAHQVLPVDGEVLVCDLGTDRIHRLRLDTSGRFSRAADPIHLPPGAGPRHAVIADDRLIVACELSSELWVARRDGDDPDHGWIETQRLSTTDATSGTRQPSGIVTNGRTVVVATRGPDTIATFGVHDGRLTRLAEVPCGGAWPRALTLHGRWLWVANTDGGSLTVLDLSDPAAPTLVSEFAAPSATCVVVLPHHPPG
jgi:6-phosphogluconolactonase